MSRRIIGGNAGKVLCDAIHTAEITYKDSAGNVLFTQPYGLVKSGGTMQVKVPVPDNITITLED